MWVMWLAALGAQAVTEEQMMSALASAAEARNLRQAPGAPVIGDDEYKKVAAGKVMTGVVSVDGYAAKKAWGAGVLDVPIGLAWAAVNDELRHPGYTGIEWNELVAGEPCVSGRRVLQYLPVPIIWDRWWVTQITANDAVSARSAGAARELWWESSVDPAEITSDEGKRRIAKAVPIAFSKGGWFFVDLGNDQTLLEYYVWSDPGGRVPAGAASSFAAGSIEDTIEAIETFAKEASPRCPQD